MILTGAFFFIHDMIVRREFSAKRELLHSKRKFVRFVSHEVRTPLNAAIVGLTLLLDEMTTKEENTDKATDTATISRESSLSDDQIQNALTRGWRTLTNDVLGNAMTAVDVLNDLLNYDKIQMGSFNLELSVLNIWDLVQECVQEFCLQARQQGVQLFLDFNSLRDRKSSHGVEAVHDLSRLSSRHLGAITPQDMKMRKVVGDKVRISQVIRNLVSNGLKVRNSVCDLFI